MDNQTGKNQIYTDICNKKLKKFKDESQSSHVPFTNTEGHDLVNFCKQRSSIGLKEINSQNFIDPSQTGKCFF